MVLKRIISGLMLTLLASILALTVNIQPVKAIGPIYIRADGSIDPPTADIITVDNVTYDFTGNIADSIVVERDNIVVNGAGYTLHGTGSGTGIAVSGRDNVTIKNMEITLFYHGIYLNVSSDYCNISGNNITNNKKCILLNNSSNNAISGNNITDNQYGVLLDYSSNNAVSGNNITLGMYGIWLRSSSSFNNVSDNCITSNRYGITLDSASNCNTVSGNSMTNNGNGITLDSASNNTISGNIFVRDGLWVFDSYGNIVEDNIINGKPLVYLEGASNQTVAEAGQVILVNCEYIQVQNLNLSHTTVGLQLWQTNNTLVSGNCITNNGYGIGLFYSSSFNSVSGNCITNNMAGVWLRYSSNHNTVSGNKIIRNNDGITLDSASDNTISGNNITNNTFGILFYPPSNHNSIYHNNFINNTVQTYNSFLSYSDVWDNGYPSGGNYWSDYVGVDLNHDGIGDSEREVDVSNLDRYPLMGMFSSFNATSEYCIQTISNSTISDFKFNGTTIIFNVSGKNGTFGFCRILIPISLMNGTYRVFVNGTEILPPPSPLPCSNSTHSYLYFTYEHSTQEVVITPEFRLILIIPFIMITTLLAAIVYKRKHTF